MSPLPDRRDPDRVAVLGWVGGRGRIATDAQTDQSFGRQHGVGIIVKLQSQAWLSVDGRARRVGGREGVERSPRGVEARTRAVGGVLEDLLVHAAGRDGRLRLSSCTPTVFRRCVGHGDGAGPGVVQPDAVRSSPRWWSTLASRPACSSGSPTGWSAAEPSRGSRSWRRRRPLKMSTCTGLSETTCAADRHPGHVGGCPSSSVTLRRLEGRRRRRRRSCPPWLSSSPAMIERAVYSNIW